MRIVIFNCFHGCFVENRIQTLIILPPFVIFLWFIDRAWAACDWSGDCGVVFSFILEYSSVVELCFLLCVERYQRSQNVLSCSFVRFICFDNLSTLGWVNWSHVAESCWFLLKVLWDKENKTFFSRSFVNCIYNFYPISIFIFISATFLFHFHLMRVVV